MIDRGIPRVTHKNTDELTIKVAELMDLTLATNDIEVSHRTSNEKYASIIVKFQSRRTRDQFYQGRKKLRFHNQLHWLVRYISMKALLLLMASCLKMLEVVYLQLKNHPTKNSNMSGHVMVLFLLKKLTTRIKSSSNL